MLVGAISEGLKLGHKIESIYLQRFNGDVYQYFDCNKKLCTENFKNGFYGVFDGVHRFMASKKLGMDIFCEFPPIWAEDPDYMFSSEEVFSINGISNKGIERRVANSLSYLPRKIAEGFCSKNKLEIERFLSQ